MYLLLYGVLALQITAFHLRSSFIDDCTNQNDGVGNRSM